MKRERSSKPKRAAIARGGRKPSPPSPRRPIRKQPSTRPPEEKSAIAPATIPAQNTPAVPTPPKIAIVTTESAPQGLVLMKLPPKRVLSFTWSWFWRSAVYTVMVMVAAMGVGFLAGFLAGIIFLFASPGDSAKQFFLQAMGLVIGGMVGFGSLPFFLQWMTTHKLGKFRLLLVAEEKRAG